MIILKKTAWTGSLFLACLILLHLSAFEVQAADSSGDWRPLFDLVMRWVNFLILAFLLIKFSRAPIKKFLADKKQTIADEIGNLEAEKDQILRQIEESKKQLKHSKERLSELKKRIVAQGEKNKQKMIAEAELESKMMLKSAKEKMDHRIVEARHVLKTELIDSAIARAIEMLPGKITEEDNRKFIDVFVSSASSK
ncbi:MAG: ATP synthase F0 subunit B [Deltaproteobacteria bacterium]|nr:ATP synthase F0 subunit B [Deltaproteobacteria bacterium]